MDAGKHSGTGALAPAQTLLQPDALANKQHPTKHPDAHALDSGSWMSDLTKLMASQLWKPDKR